MKSYSRVLAAIDFSKPARDAFRHALALSTRHAAELVVVHAVTSDQPFSRHAGARVALMAKLRREAAQAHVQFTERVQTGDPAEIILLHARSLRPDVIVMGTHQRTGINRLRQGSIAERVIANATVPVLLVPSGLAATAAFRRVVVATDLREASRGGIEEGLVMAGHPDDRITLVHVVPGFPSGVPRHLHRYGVAEHQRALAREAQRQLQLAVSANREIPATVHTRVLVGDAAAQIRGAVQETGADLLVLGVPKRGAVSRALFGSTATRLLKSVTVPILAVPDAVGGVHAQNAGMPRAA